MIDIMNLLLCIIGVVVVVEATSSSFLIQDGSSVKAFSKRYGGRNLALSPATCWKDCLPLKPPSCVRQCQGRKRKRRERCVEDCKPIRKKEHVAFKLCQKNCRTAVVRAKLARVAPPETASAADGRLAAQPDPTAEEDPGVKVEEKVVKTEDEHEIEELEKEEAEAIREVQIEEIEKKQLPVRIAVLPDHPTPVELRKHVKDPVPVILWGEGITPDQVEVYDEESVKEGSLGTMDQKTFFVLFFN